MLAGTPAEDLLQSAYRRLAEQWASQESALIQRLACAPAVSASPADMLEALAWAEAVVERHAVVDKESGRAAVTYLASAIPQVPLPACYNLTLAHTRIGRCTT